MNRSIEEINRIVDIVMTDDEIIDITGITAEELENIK